MDLSNSLNLKYLKHRMFFFVFCEETVCSEMASFRCCVQIPIRQTFLEQVNQTFFKSKSRKFYLDYPSTDSNESPRKVLKI